MSPLRQPVWAALTGPHRAFGRTHGRVAGYLPEVAPFAGFAPGPDPEAGPDQGAWDDLAAYAGPDRAVFVAGLPGPPPDGWHVGFAIPVVQMVAAVPARAGGSLPEPSGGLPAGQVKLTAGQVELTAADVPEMLDLVQRTRPGPFGPRTIELGRYIGVRRDGRLVAMAGERMHPPGHTEISAVCTDPAARGLGLATHLVGTLAAGIRARGETPFLHVAETNTAAVRLYGRLGYRATHTAVFAALTAPAG